jgi:hypothetical protein
MAGCGLCSTIMRIPHFGQSGRGVAGESISKIWSVSDMMPFSSWVIAKTIRQRSAPRVRSLGAAHCHRISPGLYFDFLAILARESVRAKQASV